MNDDVQSVILEFLEFETLVNLGFSKQALNVYDSDKHRWSWACGNGKLEVVKWLHNNIPNDEDFDDTDGWWNNDSYGYCTVLAMDWAARNGHLDVVKFLHEHRTEGCTVDAMDQAACYGHLEVVMWLHENRTEGCTKHAMEWAARNGHLDVVKFLHENRTEGCTIDAMDQAACYGHLEVVMWLHENRTEGCTKHAMDEAARNGHLDVVKFLHENLYDILRILTMVNIFKRNLKIIFWISSYLSYQQLVQDFVQLCQVSPNQLFHEPSPKKDL
jgi:Ankyrin repeats (3 copies)